MPRTLASLTVVAFAIVLLCAPGAQAGGCGPVARRHATKRLAPNHAPLIIGDSVLLGALGPVAREGFDVDTRGCRAWKEGMQVLYARRHADTLPHLVVVELGTDQGVTDADIRYAMDIVGHKRVLVLMTPREALGVGNGDAQRMRRAAKAHPDRIVLLDWVHHSDAHPSWLAPDGIHLMTAGAAAFARFLRSVTRYAKAGVLPKAAER